MYNAVIQVMEKMEASFLVGLLLVSLIVLNVILSNSLHIMHVFNI